MIWKHIRISIREYRELDAYRRNLERAIATTPDRYPLEYRDKRTSLNDAIAYLLRGRRSRNSRKPTKKPAPDIEQSGTP